MRQLLTLLLLFFCACLPAQSVTVENFPAGKRDKPFDRLLGTHGSNYYCATGGGSFTVAMLDSQLVKVKEADLGSVTYGGKMYNFHSCLFLGDRFYVFYYGVKKNVAHLLVANIGLTSLAVIDSVRELETIPGYYENGVKIVASPEGNHVLIRIRTMGQMQLHVYDHFLEPEWSIPYNYANWYYIKDVQVSNAGTVALLHYTDVIPEGEDDYGKRPWTLAVFKKEDNKTYQIVPGDYKIFLAKIGFTKNDEPFVAGYFSVYNIEQFLGPLPMEARNCGTLFYSPVLTKGELELYPFTTAFLSENKDEKTKKYLAEREAKGFREGVEGIYYCNIFQDPDGRIYLVGEECFGGTSFGAALTAFTENTVVSVNVSGSTKDHLDNIVVTQFDSAGRFSGNTWVQKNGVDNSFASYRALATRDSLYLVFNENVVNVRDSLTLDVKRQTLRPGIAGVPVVVAVSHDGKKKLYTPFGEKEYACFLISTAMQTGEPALIFQRKKMNAPQYEFFKLRFGSVTP